FRHLGLSSAGRISDGYGRCRRPAASALRTARSGGLPARARGRRGGARVGCCRPLPNDATVVDVPRSVIEESEAALESTHSAGVGRRRRRPTPKESRTMGAYVQLGAVKTWYDERGEGEPLVLMHGGLVDARFFEPNLAALAEHFHVYTPERRGHGHTPDVEGPITYQLMTDDTIAFLASVVGQPADLVGHSDGAFVAMQVAIQRPELVKRLVMISGGFDKSGEATPEVELDVDELTGFLGKAYGEVSPDGEEHFPVVARK